MCTPSQRSLRANALPFLFATLLPTATAFCQSISGRVVDPNGTPVPGITVDAGSGSTPGVSDALGNFLLTGVSIGSNDVEVLPDPGAPWVARELLVNVSGAVNIGDVVVQPGFDIVGTALGPDGLPLMSCNLNVYDQDGLKLFTPYDNTDLTGSFAVTVPAGTWDVRVQPPVGALLVSSTLEDVVVAGTANVGAVTLRTGFPITGSVVDSVSSLPIGGVKLRAFDALTGERFHLPTDTTNVFGQFSFLSPFGLLDLQLEPPVGNTHVGREIYGIGVPGPVALGPLGLDNGVLLSGSVTAGGQPVVGADVDVLFADGTKLYTPHDATGPTGAFSVAVPAGANVQVRVEPFGSTGLVGMLTPLTVVSTPTNLGTIALASGVAVTGTVTGATGPEFDAALRFVDTTTGVEVVTVTDHTDAAGQYTTWVPAGTYTVTAATAEGSFSLDGQQGVTIAGPSNVDFSLAAKLARTEVTSYGTPTVPQGGPVPVNVLLHSIPAGLQTILVDMIIDAPDGTSTPLFLGLPLTLPPIPFVVGPLFVPLFPVPPSMLGKPMELRVRLRDVTGLVTLDEGQATYYVQ